MDSKLSRMLTRRHFLGCACGTIAAGLLGPIDCTAHPKSKKLIEFGADSPDPAFLRAHAAMMQKTPFAGTVFHANYRMPNGQTGNFTRKAWGRQRFHKRDLEASLKNLKAARLGTLDRNFFLFDVTPADLDWFDDYSAVIANAQLAAWFARESHCPGLMFDPEAYGEQLWQYPKQRDAKSKSWEQYTRQVRLRGRQVMEAFQRGYPGLTVFLTGAYSYVWRQMHRRPFPLHQMRYGMLPSFLDGMLDVAEGKSRFIDGYEAAYGFRSPSEFPKAYQAMKHGCLPIVADQAKYSKYFSCSFGIWMDWRSDKLGWSTKDLAKNGHPPKQFQALVTRALEVADEYVWIFTYAPRWWAAPDGKPVKVPAAYETALKRALEAANS